MILALYDIETNGLLEAKEEKGQITPPMDRVHSLCFRLRNMKTGEARNISACDQPGFQTGMSHYYLPAQKADLDGIPRPASPRGLCA